MVSDRVVIKKSRHLMQNRDTKLFVKCEAGREEPQPLKHDNVTGIERGLSDELNIHHKIMKQTDLTTEPG